VNPTSTQFKPIVKSVPIARELSPVPRVSEAFKKVQHLPGCLLLDSSMRSQGNSIHPLGRYSFLLVEPFDSLVCEIGASLPFAKIRNQLERFSIEPLPDLPPFQGGMAGLLSYDLNQSLEQIAGSQIDEFCLPAVALGSYDSVLAWDHEQDRCWIIATGLPKLDEAERRRAAFRTLNRWQDRLSDCETTIPESPAADLIRPQRSLPTDVGFEPELFSNFSKEDYLRTIQTCIDYIYAGDVFQINLAQRLLVEARSSSANLYHRLRTCNPAPFSGYFDLNSFGWNAQIISASPERFFSVRERVVETRPIKGTRRRTGTPLVDLWSKSKLEASTKDRAENTMIVDLMRNDLSRCCEDTSIEVPLLCQLEEYQSVIHLVSSVRGRLKPQAGLVDLVESIFPGGSITGAPKVRAMEIIAELEPHRRGAYCGALGYLGFDGSADFNILIRTITAAGGWWQIPVGGGIVSQSDPMSEYEETWTKAAGMLRAVNA
jgi:para-aminobenzoate synthetase component 1